jgi:hypothetical protein
MGQFQRGSKLYNTKSKQYMILVPKSFRFMQEWLIFDLT